MRQVFIRGIISLVWFAVAIITIMKEGTAMQESRLFKILYHLLNKGHATAPELAKKFEVSVRTLVDMSYSKTVRGA